MFAASKLAGEIYCRAYHAAGHVEAVVLRYFHVYGPREAGAVRTPIVPGLIDTLRRRRRPALEGDGRAVHDLVYVEDVVAVTLAASVAPAAAGRTFNIGSGQGTSMLEMVDILNRLLRTEVVPRFTRVRGTVARPLRARIGLATEVFGWTPRVSLVTGLARSLQFLTESDSTDEHLLAEVTSHEERPNV
jgi:nucleoside-diphosphate-sugar epimerase